MASGCTSVKYHCGQFQSRCRQHDVGTQKVGEEDRCSSAVTLKPEKKG